MEIHHRLNQLDSLGFLPFAIRRFLIDENIPGASLTLVPDLTPKDFLTLLENPTSEKVEYWTLRGERSVWPAIGALKVRCAVEVELDRAYQRYCKKYILSEICPDLFANNYRVRWRKPMDFVEGGENRKENRGKRSRAQSIGGAGIPPPGKKTPSW
jgi:TAG lipase / lysophosphatidylethanolamine acyltransferase